MIAKIGRNKWDLKECVQSYIEYKIANATSTYGLTASDAEGIADAEIKTDFGRKKWRSSADFQVFKLEKDLSDIASTLSNSFTISLIK